MVDAGRVRGLAQIEAKRGKRRDIVRTGVVRQPRERWRRREFADLGAEPGPGGWRDKAAEVVPEPRAQRVEGGDLPAEQCTRKTGAECSAELEAGLL